MVALLNAMMALLVLFFDHFGQKIELKVLPQHYHFNSELATKATRACSEHSDENSIGSVVKPCRGWRLPAT